MEFLYTTEISIPLFQVVLLLVFSTLSLISGKLKLALFINYLFTLYWGYIVNRDTLLDSGAQSTSSFTLIYFGFGLVFTLAVLIGLMRHTRTYG